MPGHRISTLVTCLALAGTAWLHAADLARWEAGSPAQSHGIALAQSEDSQWRVGPVNGRAVAILKPSDSYYTPAPYRFRISAAVPEDIWLAAEFVDKGYGLITISPGRPESHQWGVARVNSGGVRTAVFHFDKGTLRDAVQFVGMNYLKSVRLTTTPPEIVPVPLVEPAIQFQVPSQRVTTAAGEELSPDHVRDAPAHLRNRLPLVRALGFNGVESYVKWGLVEKTPGVFDWSFYDSVVDALEKHGLKWFPMLVVGSGYALPEWFWKSPDNVRFQCLEHRMEDDTQSIWYPGQAKYAQRFLMEFGKHYGPRKALLGIRLGPSGNYGEAQYPAIGPGFAFRPAHNHIGYWAGDAWASKEFRTYLQKEYGDIGKLNKAWKSSYTSFDEITTFLPDSLQTRENPAEGRRKRLDFGTFYIDSMSLWCEKWAVWAREALPSSVIHQSSGGWGALQIGTDYAFHARSMSKVHGGVRLTNESDNFADNFTITRMASSAARYYGAALGFEPGGYASKRGVMARLFNAVTNGGEHLFYYLFNLTDNDQAVEAWVRYGNLMDVRAKPVIDVAAFYSDTAVKLDDDMMRYRWGSPFFNVARAMRAVVDYDYCNEQMIGDGALERFKVLMFLWGPTTEKPVLEKIDAWVRAGGTVIFPRQPRGYPSTVEGDQSIAGRWLAGDTGKGRAIVWNGDGVPPDSYAEFVEEQLKKMTNLRPAVRQALAMTKTREVYWSVLENGKLALLNFSNHPTTVRLANGRQVTMEPYGISMQ